MLARSGCEQVLAPGTIDANVLRTLESYAWPGNVRELRNLIEGSVLLRETPKLDSLPGEFVEAMAPAQDGGTGVRSIAEGEEELIRRAISASGGTLTLAARRLHIAKSTPHITMHRYDPPRDTVNRQ